MLAILGIGEDMKNILIENEKNYCDYLYEIDSLDMYLKTIMKPYLSAEEEYELCRKAKNGDLKAKEILIERNLKNVYMVAKNYVDRGVEPWDLIQEGNVGLMKAFEKYNIDSNIRFINYAYFWIRHSIIRAIENKSRLIKLPERKIELLIKYKKGKEHLETMLKRTPSVMELKHYFQFPLRLINELENYLLEIESLDVLGLDDNIHYDLIEEPFEEKIIDRDYYERILILMRDILNEREYEVLTKNIGINGEPMSFSKLAKLLGISCQRIGQIKLLAVKKIKEALEPDNNEVEINEFLKIELAIKEYSQKKKLMKSK